MLVASGCAQEEYPLGLYLAQHPDASTTPTTLIEAGTSQDAQDAPVSTPDRGPAQCAQARSTPLPQRLVAIAAGADAGAADAAAEASGPAGMNFFEGDLYQQYYVPNCGGCHGTAVSNGGFDVTSAADFKAKMDATVLAHITSEGPSKGHMAMDPNDPLDPMPPFRPFGTGLPYSQRATTDSIVHFVTLIKAWLAANKADPFFVASSGPAPAATPASASTAPMVPIPSAFVGDSMTNIGNCIPTPGLVGIEQTKSAALDDYFAHAQAADTGTPAQMIGLPIHLSDTDLVTFDSAILAQYGVVAFAPGYPLFSDNAGKLRYIRLPRGTSIQFDKATQKWTIPPNTRFYKTFMKQVVDVDGSMRFKKIETRLIVARPDTVNADGSRSATALFGTYIWTEDESDAVLNQDTLNDGRPFPDRLLQYTTDAPLAADILSGLSVNGSPEIALLQGGAARHYAVPSSDRCNDCHMGSGTSTFSLGFLPLQISRHPVGESGVIEPTGPDELTQLQRFIDYGLITGMDSPDDVLPLEQSEGTRSPRNDYEVRAQGYVLGNCSHCHNPHGFPSVQSPALVPLLNFLPSVEGGIFQFPLERYSPRIFRGVTAQNLIPYITPSLLDLPRTDVSGNPVPDPFLQIAGGNGASYISQGMFAPWRSLIYRNVDNLFAYTDDVALYPHMPFHTPGFDPRARQMLSEWMVSIPALRKNPEIPEYAFYTLGGTFGGAVDTNFQPYVEVHPGDPRYDGAVAAANERLRLLHNGVGGAVAPGANPDAGSGADSGADASAHAAPGAPPMTPSQTLVPTGPKSVGSYTRWKDVSGCVDDILDPAVLQDPVCSPVPTPPLAPPLSAISGAVPDHCHWVITDSTLPLGNWAPRRPDWATILGGDEVSSATGNAQCGVSPQGQAAAALDQATAIAAVQNLPPLASVERDLTAPRAFGLWQQKPGCKFTSETGPPVSSFKNPPAWMQGLSPDAPVYSQTAGQAVFKMICINCHGPIADSSGRLADNLATMTGGFAQVADFRDGLFGPVGGDFANINRVFAATGLPTGPWTAAGITPFDRASRYMAWMALGGTRVHIPDGILQIVSLTNVLGVPRLAAPAGQKISANMLSTAKGLCEVLMGCHDGDICVFNPSTPLGYTKTFVTSNGDRDLWLHLCTLNNPPPIHVVGGNGGFPQDLDAPFNGEGVFESAGDSLIKPEAYPPGAPVGGNLSLNQGFGPDGAGNAVNVFPWCFASFEPNPPPGWPVCPKGSSGVPVDADPAATFTTQDEENWVVRGAINAGLAVFLYVKSLEGVESPPPDYTQCEQLP
jgi:mono/diheme cytochrome c family protein